MGYASPRARPQASQCSAAAWGWPAVGRRHRVSPGQLPERGEPRLRGRRQFSQDEWHRGLPEGHDGPVRRVRGRDGGGGQKSGGGAPLLGERVKPAGKCLRRIDDGIHTGISPTADDPSSPTAERGFTSGYWSPARVAI